MCLNPNPTRNVLRWALVAVVVLGHGEHDSPTEKAEACEDYVHFADVTLEDVVHFYSMLTLSEFHAAQVEYTLSQLAAAASGETQITLAKMAL